MIEEKSTCKKKKEMHLAKELIYTRKIVKQ